MFSRFRYSLRTLFFVMLLVVVGGVSYKLTKPGPIVFPAKAVFNGRVELVWILAVHEKHERYNAVAWGWRREDFPAAEERSLYAHYYTTYGAVRRYPHGNPFELGNGHGQYLTFVTELNSVLFTAGWAQVPDR